MRTTKDFKSLILWQKADSVFQMIAHDVKRWPNERVANSIVFQLLGAAGSISANIAEGYGRGTPREFEQFIRYSRGSAAETENWLLKAQREGLLELKRYQEYEGKLEEVRKISGAFIYKLRLQPSKRLNGSPLDRSIARSLDS